MELIGEQKFEVDTVQRTTLMYLFRILRGHPTVVPMRYGMVSVYTAVEEL
jgi:hypothetical protein